MNLFKSFLRRFQDHNSDERQQRNRDALASLGDGDANSRHIASRKALGHEAARLTAIALRRMKEDKQKAQAQIELYLDDWTFHNGPIRTQEQFNNAIRDCVDRIRRRHQAARQLAADAAENDLTGLKDFPF
jgi:hypothetical protein